MEFLLGRYDIGISNGEKSSSGRVHPKITEGYGMLLLISTPNLYFYS